MRIFEILLFIFTGLTLVLLFPLKGIHKKLQTITAGASLLALIGHVLIEKTRWQMIPVIVITILLALLVVVHYLREKTEKPAKLPRWAWILAVVLLIVALLPPVLFPVPALPDPTGPYAVGTTSFDWVDENREETLSPTPAGKRHIMVQIWYPAKKDANAQLAPYMEKMDITGPVLARQLHLPSFLFDHIGLAKTHSYLNLPISSGESRYPVLIFSHGWTGVRTQNTYQAEDLASHGYIVIAPDHTYGAGIVVFQDGSVVFNNPKLIPDDSVNRTEYDRVVRILGQAWVGDLRFALDQAELLNSGDIPSIFAGKLDLDRVGFFGHSTGGGAVIETCALDERCKAGLSEDAWLLPYSREMLETGVKQPFFFMQSENWSSQRNTALFNTLFTNMQPPAYKLAIKGAGHYDFSDIPLLTPLATAIGLKGPINSQRGLAIVNTYTLAFFDQTLKGIPSSLLEGQSANYPETVFTEK